MPQCVSKMVQVSNLYLQRGAAKILNKVLLKFGCKPIYILTAENLGVCFSFFLENYLMDFS